MAKEPWLLHCVFHFCMHYWRSWVYKQFVIEFGSHGHLILELLCLPALEVVVVEYKSCLKKLYVNCICRKLGQLYEKLILCRQWSRFRKWSIYFMTQANSPWIWITLRNWQSFSSEFLTVESLLSVCFKVHFISVLNFVVLVAVVQVIEPGNLLWSGLRFYLLLFLRTATVVYLDARSWMNLANLLNALLLQIQNWFQTRRENHLYEETSLNAAKETHAIPGALN